MTNIAGGNIVIKLDGPANIRSVSDLYPRVVEAIARGKQVVFDVSDDIDVDLSFVQLVESARLSGGTAVTLSRPASGRLLEVLKRGGFIETASKDDALFWLHEETV